MIYKVFLKFAGAFKIINRQTETIYAWVINQPLFNYVKITSDKRVFSGILKKRTEDWLKSGTPSISFDGLIFKRIPSPEDESYEILITEEHQIERKVV